MRGCFQRQQKVHDQNEGKKEAKQLAPLKCKLQLEMHFWETVKNEQINGMFCILNICIYSTYLAHLYLHLRRGDARMVKQKQKQVVRSRTSFHYSGIQKMVCISLLLLKGCSLFGCVRTPIRG